MSSPLVETPYNEDGLHSIHNHDFAVDPRFLDAYERGVAAAGDPNFRWRVHIALWAAAHARHLPGDFVECGAGWGFLSSAIMRYLNWNADMGGRRFVLFDTWSGIDPDQLNEHEIALGRRDAYANFPDYYEHARDNYAEFERVVMVRGRVPDTLARVDVGRVAFLSVDMNAALPEVAAMHHFWPRLVPGAIVVLDDYAFSGYHPQKIAMDEFAVAQGVEIASLPTGQGVLLKPGTIPTRPLRLARKVAARLRARGWRV